MLRGVTDSFVSLRRLLAAGVLCAAAATAAGCADGGGPAGPSPSSSVCPSGSPTASVLPGGEDPPLEPLDPSVSAGIASAPCPSDTAEAAAEEGPDCDAGDRRQGDRDCGPRRRAKATPSRTPTRQPATVPRTGTKPR